jgi:hypothetical protein
MSPPPRHTAAPTVPPPDAGDIAKRIADWKVILGVAVAIFLAGAAALRWDASHPDRDDAARDRAAATSAVVAVQAEVSSLRDRVTRTETTLDWIKGALYQVAQKTGATSVPPPPP